MTVPGGTDKNSAHSEPRTRAEIVGAVVGAFAPACYVPSWVPWFRWVGAGIVVVILLITLSVVTAAGYAFPVVP